MLFRSENFLTDAPKIVPFISEYSVTDRMPDLAFSTRIFNIYTQTGSLELNTTAFVEITIITN